MEENLGELVPAELVVSINREAQKEPYIEEVKQEQIARAIEAAPPGHRRSPLTTCLSTTT